MVGRPKKKRFGAPSVNKIQRTNNNHDIHTDSNLGQKRGRGRPKGSQNKNKDEPQLNRQKTSTDYFSEDNSSCMICMFKFTDPIKRDKPITRT